MFATSAIRWSYKHLCKPLFFRRDPEDVHDTIVALGSKLGAWRLLQSLTRSTLAYQHPVLRQTIHGITFENPIGLAAGFDKNAQLTNILPDVGFGFEEVGSITGEYCAGNPKPRLWRLPASQGLVVWYGLKNDGCEAIASRLAKSTFRFPVGISVAKTNCAATVDRTAGIADYAKAFRAFAHLGAYLTVNISCPNTFGGEPFTSADALDELLRALDAIETSRPVFLKMPADLSLTELDALLHVIQRHRVHGLIFSNLTKKRDRPEIVQTEIASRDKGGISGKPTSQASNTLLAHVYRTTGTRYVLIGCGGVFSAQDAYEKIRQGASLIQLVTGMIFEGPQLIGEINRELVSLLKRDGFSSISEAIGAAHRVA